MKSSTVAKDFELFLDSIGGLENGFYADMPPITSRDFFDVGDGWLPVIREVIEGAIALGWDKQICQVKEKFGGLRFYINSAPREVHEFIAIKIQEADDICEVCGNFGSLRRGKWWRTLCKEHTTRDLWTEQEFTLDGLADEELADSFVFPVELSASEQAEADAQLKAMRSGSTDMDNETRDGLMEMQKRFKKEDGE